MDILSSINALLEIGGNVLRLILIVSICLWCLIAERLIFLAVYYPKLKQQWLQQWQQRVDKASRDSLKIREFIISEARIQMNKTLPIIKMLVGLCPLLGLLGTVTGMIHVFDVMKVTGTGNVRAMASGISHATITTMAGMVIAITGLYCSRLIEEKVSDETHLLADLLTYH